MSLFAKVFNRDEMWGRRTFFCECLPQEWALKFNKGFFLSLVIILSRCGFRVVTAIFGFKVFTVAQTFLERIAVNLLIRSVIGKL